MNIWQLGLVGNQTRYKALVFLEKSPDAPSSK
jgi:hypothetical protein